MKNILIVGAGAVGGFFGAHLARKHSNVSFLLRPHSQAEVVRKGLTIRSVIRESFTVRPVSAIDPTVLPQPDLIILGMKTYDIKESVVQLEKIMRPDTTILTLQNGVTIEDILIAKFGRERIVGGVAFIYSKMIEPGVIEHYKKGMLTIGEMMGMESTRVQQIQKIFSESGVPCSVSRDIRRAKWEKMCWNCVFNPLTVLVNDCVARALDHPELQSVIATIVREVSAVAMGHRVPLDEDMPEKVVKWSQELRDIHSSMYDDWKAGRSTEIDDLNGYITAKGRELGVPTPLNEMLTALIKSVTTGEPKEEPVLRIEGEVRQPLQFTRITLAQLSSEHQIPEVDTVMPGMKGRGVKFKSILDVLTCNIGADHVCFFSQDEKYSVCLTLKQAEDFGILVYEDEGRALSYERGGPFRLVTPGLGDLCANVKDVGRIVLSQGKGYDTRPAQSCKEAF